MPLLLTSSGLDSPDVAKAFLDLVDVKTVKVAFVTIASRTGEEKVYVDKSRKELLGLGVLDDNILVIDGDSYDENELLKCGCIYVCGGNTFFLLDKIRHDGVADIILHRVKEEDALYVGVSAGSIIAGLSVLSAVGFDENDIELKDLEGLALVDVNIAPHYRDEDEKVLASVPDLVHLSDGEALVVKGKNRELISLK